MAHKEYVDGREVREVADQDSASDTNSESEEESELSASEPEEDISWIQWFCSIKGNEFFCEVDEDWIQDEFNLYGLSNQVQFYDHALDLILDFESPAEDLLTDKQQEYVEAAAEQLYGLIHQRYILTARGLTKMHDKYDRCEFGRCPRAFCMGQPVLPVGQSDIPQEYAVKIYCPKCEDIYYPRSSRQGNLDGAYFGTTFPHLFFMTYPELLPQKCTMTYVPRVFGFKIRREPLPGDDDKGKNKKGDDKKPLARPSSAMGSTATRK